MNGQTFDEFVQKKLGGDKTGKVSFDKFVAEKLAKPKKREPLEAEHPWQKEFLPEMVKGSPFLQKLMSMSGLPGAAGVGQALAPGGTPIDPKQAVAGVRDMALDALERTGLPSYGKVMEGMAEKEAGKHRARAAIDTLEAGGTLAVPPDVKKESPLMELPGNVVDFAKGAISFAPELAVEFMHDPGKAINERAFDLAFTAYAGLKPPVKAGLTRAYNKFRSGSLSSADMNAVLKDVAAELGKSPEWRPVAGKITEALPKEPVAPKVAPKAGVVKEPWEMTKKEFVSDVHLDAAGNQILNHERMGPSPNRFKEGALAADIYEPNPHLYRMEYIDPKTISFSLEGQSREAIVKMTSTQKYIDWYKQGIEPPPIDVVRRIDDGSLMSSNRRRVIAAQEAGADRIPAFVEIGRHKDMVKQAVAEGKPVPPQVLKDYPDLAKPSPKPLELTREQMGMGLDEFEAGIKGLNLKMVDNNGNPINIYAKPTKKAPVVKPAAQIVDKETRAVDPRYPVASTPPIGEPLVVMSRETKGSMPLFQHEINNFAPREWSKGVPGKGLYNDIDLGPLKTIIENPIRVFEKFPEIYDTVFHPYNVGTNQIAIAKSARTQKIAAWKKTGASQTKIGAHLTAAQEGGLERLRLTGQDSLLKVPLTEAEKAILKEIRSGYDKYYGDINRARDVMGQAPMERIPEYYTWITDYANDKFSPFTDSPVLVRKHLKSLQFKYAQERTPGAKRPVNLNAFDVFDEYGYRADKVIHMAPTISKARAFLDDMKVPRFSKSQGKTVYEDWKLGDTYPNLERYVSEWVDAVGGIEKGSTSPYIRAVEKFGEKLTNNVVTAALGANLRSAAIQPTALRMAYPILGEKYLAEGIARNISPKWREFALDNANVLQARSMDYHISKITDKTFGKKLSEVRASAANKSVALLKFLDFETARSVWLGGYEMGLRYHKMPHAAAVKFADNVVIRTQGSGLPGHAAPIQRSGIGKIITAFQTYPINEWNEIVSRFGHKMPKHLSRGYPQDILRMALGTSAINILYEMGLGLRSPIASPEAEFFKQWDAGERNPMKLGGGILKETAEMLPIVGGTLRWTTGSFKPMFPALQSYSDAATLIDKIVFRADYDKITPKDIEVVGRILGIPGSVSVRRFIEMRRKGFSVPASLFGARGDITSTGQAVGGAEKKSKGWVTY